MLTLVRHGLFPDGAAGQGRRGAEPVRARGRLRGYGAYVDGPDRPRGLIYRPFAEYARDKHAMEAEVITELDPARLTAELDAGRLVIASVSSQIRLPRQSRPAPAVTWYWSPVTPAA